jgi:hypothetical protein
MPTFVKAIAFAALLLVVPIVAAAQDDPDLAPPPLKAMSKSERGRLNAEPNPKRRTALALELLGERLRLADTLRADERYEEVLPQLGAFAAILDDTMKFLTGRSIDRDKSLDGLKRFEIGLRGFTPRIENIRRDVPARYEYHVRMLGQYVRDARSRAIEPFFGNAIEPNKP